MMYKKMIHDIRYLGLAGEINFSKEPYMYQDTDLFNYNIEYDLNYFPSGRGGKVKRFKQAPQVNTLTLGVINRTDVRELVSKLERHFQVDINAKTPAKLFINGSYTECYIVSSVKTYFNRFLGINFITLEILREKPVWTIEEEYSYQKANLQTNPYDLNLITPPYDFSNFEFTQPTRLLKEANLIKNGWDDFEPYGSGKNYVIDYDDPKNRYQLSETLPKGTEVYMIYYGERNSSNFTQITDQTGAWAGEIWWGGHKTDIDNFYVRKSKLVRDTFELRVGSRPYKFFVCKVDDPVIFVEKKSLGNGLTRVQTWGGKEKIKLSQKTLVPESSKSYSMWVNNLSDNPMVVRDGASQGVVKVGSNQNVYVQFTSTSTYGFRVLSNDSSDNLDFIASDPVIYEDDGSMIYDIQEYEGKYRIFTMNSHSRTKMKLPIKKSIFKNEQYTHSVYAENLSDKDVLITSEKGIYINDPVIEVKPNEKGVYAYTGTVAEDNLYTTFEIATKEPKDDINIILDKPAVRYGDKPFDWPPEEEIVPLKLPTHIPFWITVDDSVKYISNNSIGDTLAKITVFGPIKNPTLYIGSNTYRVYEELLENERIEIDQRAKTVTKITSSGDRVNVFHLRDKEHSIFKAIPEGENAITQNDDFSYTIILYHERNEPKWT